MFCCIEMVVKEAGEKQRELGRSAAYKYFGTPLTNISVVSC